MSNKKKQTCPQSGVIPYRFQDDDLEILLVTARSAPMWVIPKGHLEPDMSVAASAAKEAWEEAGVEGRVFTKPIGTFFYVRRGTEYHVDVFPLHVTKVHDEWDESHQRQREWMTLREARKRILSESLKVMLKKLGPFILLHEATATENP